MTLPAKISVQNPKPFSKEEIIELENLTGLTFTDELVSLFTKYAGGKPTIDGKDCLIKILFEDGHKDSNWIMKIESFESIKKTWQYNGYLKEFKKLFEIPDSYVQTEYLIPIMELISHTIYYASGGMHSGKIYHVDNGDFGILKIADSLDDLMDKIYIK